MIGELDNKKLLLNIAVYNKILAEYLLNDISLMDEINTSTLYEEIHYEFDKEGWEELEVVSKMIPCNINSKVYYLIMLNI